MISFDDLSDNEKAKLIWYKGEFITSIYSEGIKFNLFSLKDIFVEIRFHHLTNEMMGISILSETELERYLNSIKIAEILN